MSKGKYIGSAIGIAFAGIMGVTTLHGDGDDFVKHHEGEKLASYVDAAGIKTICSGHTKGVQLGDTATSRTCERLRGEDMQEAFGALERNVKVRLNNKIGFALTSFVFNVGGGAFANSTLLRKLNAGDYMGACNEMMRWIYVNKKVLHGLVLRRRDESMLCIEGVKDGIQ